MSWMRSSVGLPPRLHFRWLPRRSGAAARAAVAVAAAACASAPGSLAAQGAPPASPRAVTAERGVVPAGLLIRQLDGVKRVLMIGAHPDDEDTGMLAALARGEGARVAYLSLNRGEGGQNLIGPEMDEGLGLVRTGELLAARELDGGEQYFTRAFDFGFSRSAEESFSHWAREELLADVVRVIRTFRPQVVVSVFSGTPRDGHGQHQVAGILSEEAFDAAGDAERFPRQLDEGLEPWRPSKLYRLVWRDPAAATVAVETGRFDPLLGRSHFQLAMESRSRHRSQDMGAGQPAGPRRSGAELVRSHVPLPDGDEESLFAGVDTTLAGLVEREPGAGGATAEAVAAYRAAVKEAAGSLDALRPWAAAPPLAPPPPGPRAGRLGGRSRAPTGSSPAPSTSVSRSPGARFSRRRGSCSTCAPTAISSSRGSRSAWRSSSGTAARSP